jgi:ABC-type dipeptide/oligopeptide/nickel transport system permease subunit
VLGTDDRGRDVLARLIYGFRVSVLFGLALTAIGVVIGVITGAIQGYFGGRIDLAFQRFIEIWGSMPELYLLLIFASLFEPGVLILLVILSLFGWMGLSDYVRAEFLRNRNLEYVTAARALGLSSWQIIRRHVLPNSLTPVIAFLPFRMSGAILALTSLDFLGLGVPPSTASLGELLAQGKANLDAWWITLSTFGVLVGTLMLLIFIAHRPRYPAGLTMAPPSTIERAFGDAPPERSAHRPWRIRRRGHDPGGAEPPLLEVDGLTVEFDGRLDGVSFSIEKFALVGESGSRRSRPCRCCGSPATRGSG